MALVSRRLIISSAVLGAVAVLSVVYYYIDPMTVMAPKCPFKFLTGWSCPACGAQRALHSLMHLHFAEAIKHNLFLIVGLPYLLLVAFVKVAGEERFPKITTLAYSQITAFVYVALFFAWWIVRNLLGI